MKVENFIFSPSCLVTQPCSFFVGLSLLQRWKVSLLVLNYCWLSLPFKWEKTSVMGRQTSTIELLQLSLIFSDDNLLLLMTDTFSYLLFPKLFCPKKLSLVTKNPYRPFFHVWDWSILPLLENELYKRVFNVPFTSGHSTQYFDLSKKWSHVISRDVLESFHVYQISIRFHPLCQSHSKETIFIWKNPVKRQKNKLQFNQNCSTKGVVDQPFVLSGQKKVSHAFVWSPTSALTAIFYDIHNYVFFQTDQARGSEFMSKIL